MSVENQLPLLHSNRYSAQPARIVTGSFITNPGVPHRTLTLTTHLRLSQILRS